MKELKSVWCFDLIRPPKSSEGDGQVDSLIATN
jgi:hypothetical protein